VAVCSVLLYRFLQYFEVGFFFVCDVNKVLIHNHASQCIFLLKALNLIRNQQVVSSSLTVGSITNPVKH
jgi:hypothetical protein